MIGRSCFLVGDWAIMFLVNDWAIVFFVNDWAIVFLQQFVFKPATNKNLKPTARLRPVTLLVVDLIRISCRVSDWAIAFFGMVGRSRW